MTLAHVQAAAALVAALILTWAGLVVAIALLLPDRTARAEAALATSTRRCFVNGLGLVVIGLIASGMLRSPDGGARVIGLALALGLAALLTVGAAGLARLLGERIGEMSGARTSFGALVRGSLVYSLALFFPLIGWYLFAPLSTVCALGAGVMAMWPARQAAAPPAAPPAAPEAA